MSRRALIFGISGQDGSYLAELLLREGYDVFGTSRDSEVSSFKTCKHLTSGTRWVLARHRSRIFAVSCKPSNSPSRTKFTT